MFKQKFTKVELKQLKQMNMNRQMFQMLGKTQQGAHNYLPRGLGQRFTRNQNRSQSGSTGKKSLSSGRSSKPRITSSRSRQNSRQSMGRTINFSRRSYNSSSISGIIQTLKPSGNTQDKLRLNNLSMYTGNTKALVAAQQQRRVMVPKNVRTIEIIENVPTVHQQAQNIMN